MNERERLGRIVAAEATDAMVANLSVRLDALLASWERAIQLERRPATPNVDDVKPRSAAEVLWELQGQINHLDLLIDELQREVGTESKLAQDWEQRAIMALHENRDDLAKQALVNMASHANAATSLGNELTELEAVRDAYRNAVAAVEVSLGR